MMNEELNDSLTVHSDSSADASSAKLPKLLVDNCNYEQLKKLSLQKLDELTSTLVSRTGELSKSKSLNNLTSPVNEENADLHSTTASDSVVESLKRENDHLQSTLKNLQKEQSDQNEKSSREFDELKSNCQQQIDKINKQLESKTRELERIVVKYAMSEKQILDAQKLKDEFERKMKDALKDKDSLLVRIKGLSNEKQSLINALDGKVNEISNGQRELDKIKKLFKEKDAQLMQFEFKLNKEQENQTETAKKLESSLKQIEELSKELNEHREANSNEEAVTSINKADLESKCREIVDLRTRNCELDEQNRTQSNRIKQLETENGRFEEERRRLSSAVDELKEQLKVCNEKLEANSRLKADYDEKIEELGQCVNELERARRENEELVTESKAYRQKEGELLEFTDRLQTKTVQLQSEHNYFEQRSAELESKFNELNETIERQRDEIAKLNGELSGGAEQHQNELNLFAKKLAEESNSKEKLKQQNDELENENKIMKKKHLQSIKELNKELISLRKRVEQNEQQSTAAEAQPQHPSNETISLSSRTDSSNSLERTSNGLNDHQSDNDNVIRTPYSNQILNTNFTSPNEIAQQLDKGVLLNKILSLQQQLGKLRSRIEFLEEHNSTLLEDIKKKSRIIQNFFLSKEAVMASNEMDNFKSQISKGVMASLYRNSVNDSTMTLELSLEINNKLQTVLEDTILKNITLKESIDTLGAEIEKMSKK